MEQLVAAATEEGQVLVQAPLETIVHEALSQAFAEEYPGIELQIVEYSGAEGFERIKAELAVGRAEADILVPTVIELQDLHDIGAFNDSFEYADYGLNEDQVTEDGLAAVWGHRPAGITYNTDRVEESEYPETWEDCTNPAFKGDIIVDTRPLFVVQLMPVMGEEEVLDFAAELAANDPVFRRGQTGSMEVLATGEQAVFCGSGYDAYRKVADRGETALEFAFPEPLPMSERHSYVLAEAAHPNAAALWNVWMFSDEAQEILDQIGNARVDSPSCSCYETAQGRTISITSGEWVERDPELNEVIVDIWQNPEPVE